MTTTTPTETITSVTETKRGATETLHLKAPPPHNNKRHAEISQEARDETLLQVENGPDKHVGRFNPKQKESGSQQEGPDGLVAATYWFLTDVLKVRAFYDKASAVLGDEKSDLMAEAAFECTHALVFISPSFRKREYSVKELNTFLYRRRQQRQLEKKKERQQEIRILPALWMVDGTTMKEFPNAVQELIWNDHDKSLNGADYLVKSLWPALIHPRLGLGGVKAPIFAATTSCRERKHYAQRSPPQGVNFGECLLTFVRLYYQPRTTSCIRKDFVDFARRKGFSIENRPQIPMVKGCNNNDAVRLKNDEDAIQVHHSEKEREVAAKSEHKKIACLSFSRSKMDKDKKRMWTDFVLERREHIQANLNVMAHYGTVTYGRAIVQRKRDGFLGLIGAAVVRLDCIIEFHSNLDDAHWEVVRLAASSIARTLRDAGATDEDLEKMIVGAAWKGSLYLLIEAPDYLLQRFYDLIIKSLAEAGSSHAR